MAASVLLIVGDNQPLLDAVVHKSRALTPGQQAGQMGPLIDTQLRDRVVAYIDDSVKRGAQVGKQLDSAGTNPLGSHYCDDMPPLLWTRRCLLRPTLGHLSCRKAHTRCALVCSLFLPSPSPQVLLDGRSWTSRAGSWVGPTVLLFDGPDYPAVREEIFGPVLSVVRVCFYPA